MEYTDENESLENMTNVLVEYIEEYVNNPSKHSIEMKQTKQKRAQDGFDDGMCELYGDMMKIMRKRVNERLKDKGIVIE